MFDPDTPLGTLLQVIRRDPQLDIYRDRVDDREALCVATRTADGASRTLRVSEWFGGYRVYWSSFHDPVDHDADADGTCSAQLELVLALVHGFLIEGRRWQDIAELGQ